MKKSSSRYWRAWPETQAAAPAAPAAGKAIPKTARVAMMTEKEKFELQEYPIPEVGDDDILVKVEGCGVCGTDAMSISAIPLT